MCGLLSDDDGDEPEEEMPEAEEGDPPEADADATEGEPVDEPDEPQAPEAEGGGEEADEGDENDLDVESTLKDLAARMSRLSSHIEGIEEDREEMEDKLDDVENQLGQLGNLAEVVSSQYNPFITEDAPSNPEWSKQDHELGRGGEDVDGPPAESPDPPDRDDMLLDEGALEEAAPHNPEDQPGEPSRPDEEASRGEGTSDDPGGEDEELPSPFGEAPDDLLDDPAEDAAGDGGGPPDPATLDLSDAPDPTAEGEDAFDRNVLLLEWVGYMMERVGRDGLLDLLEYYESLGWLEEPLKNRALRVATGIDVDAEASPDGTREWRGDTELHERTLVVLERLAGRRQRPESRLEELQLDLERIFDR